MVVRYYDSKVTSARLKQLRKEMKVENENGDKIPVTQQMLADYCEIALSSIKQYEGGKRVPDQYNMNKLCNFYKVTAEYILGESEFKNNFDRTDKENSEHVSAIKNDLKLYDFCDSLNCRVSDLNSEKDMDSFYKDVCNFIKERYMFYLKKGGK